MKVKVLMLGSELKVRGGMTTVVESYLEHHFNNIEIEYCSTHFVGNKIINLLKFFLKLPYIIFRINNNDIVHIHMSERGSCTRKMIISYLSKIFKKKVVIHLHGAEFKEYFESLDQNKQHKIMAMLLNADILLTLGSYWDNYFKSLDNNLKTRVLNNAVSIPKNNLNLNKDKINILFLAIIDKRKGIYDFIEVAKKVIVNNRGTNINFIIAGSGEEEDNVKKIIQDNNLQEYFEFTGWVRGDEKKEILKKTYLYILPSYNEGLPMSILEALSYGIPVISTNVGSISDAVINNFNGFVVQPGDVEKIISYIDYLLKNTDVWMKMSSNAKKYATEKFNQDNYFIEIEKIYSDLFKEEI